jgi:hypothetical protein
LDWTELSYLFAVSALLVSGISPIAVVWFQNKQARQTATLLLASNAQIARRAQLANADTAAALRKIHTLVNSNLTEAEQRELDATRVMLASMREVATLKEDKGLSVSVETRAAMNIAEARIAQLAANLAHKQHQTSVADALEPIDIFSKEVTEV